MTTNTNKFLAGVSAIALISVVNMTSASAQELDYATMEDIFGEAVTEGATGTPKLASEVPVNMTIIGSDEIRRSGARDIPALLRRNAGVDVQKISQTGAMVGIRGRNHDGQRLRVLINGRDTFRSHEGTTVWSALPVSMEEIRQIEIVRGPATALYGANAVAGVINIITFSPLHDNVNNVTARVGNTGVLEVSGVSTIKLGSAGGVRISGGYAKMNRFDAPMTTGTMLARAEKPESKRLSADGLFSLSDTVIFGIEGTFYEGDVVSGSRIGKADLGTTKDNSFRATISFESDFGKWTLEGFRNENDETRNSIFDLGTGEFVFSQAIEADTLSFDLTNVLTIGSTNVRFSAGYRDDKVIQFGGSSADGTGLVGYKTKYVSALADHSINDKLSIAASVRFDSLDSYRTAAELTTVPFTNADFGTFNEFSSNIGLTYKASDEGTVKLMYARGFEAPNLFAVGGQIIEPGAGAIPGVIALGGQPNLNSAIYSQYELQYIHSIEEINGKLSASVFYKDEKDLIASSISGGLTFIPTQGFYMGSENTSNANTWGVELDLSGSNDNGITWALRYAYADTKGENKTGEYIAPSSFYPFVEEFYGNRSSKHIATALIGYQKDQLSFDTMLQYKSGYSSYTDFTYIPGLLDPFREVKGLWTANATATYKINENISVQVVGEGLLNKQRQEGVALDMTVDRRFWASMSFDF